MSGDTNTGWRERTDEVQCGGAGDGRCGAPWLVPRPCLLPPRLIDEAGFASHFAAADFAAEFNLWLDTSVTITWSRVGLQDAAAVQCAFLAFTKCLRDWLTARRIPVAYIYAHENGAVLGLHTHMALYLPGATKSLPVRKEFRGWARRWVRGQFGHAVPTTLRVRGAAEETPWLHWLLFNYQLKGFDPEVTVLSARSAADGKAVMLGDLIAFAWQDPGSVSMERRLGTSRSLSISRRISGTPSDYYFPRAPALRPVDPFDERKRGTFGRYGDDGLANGPFRSRYEDGVRSVGELYGADFCERITKSVAAHDGESEADIDFSKAINMLGL